MSKLNSPGKKKQKKGGSCAPDFNVNKKELSNFYVVDKAFVYLEGVGVWGVVSSHANFEMGCSTESQILAKRATLRRHRSSDIQWWHTYHVCYSTFKSYR